MARRSPGPYQLQAAIAAVHAQAPSVQATDWTQIAMLYGELARRAPSPVVEVNRVVAVAMADGPRARLSYRRAAELFEQATLACPGGPWTLHQLRHSALTQAAQAGANTAALLA
jgi:predicted RNA polymerase sigma factor